MEEIVDIVNELDQVVGKMERSRMYAQKLRHRIVHVFVLDANDRIYLQKRSTTNSYMPGCWCVSAGGHVSSGETYNEAAKKELREELDLRTGIFPIEKFVFHKDGQDRFIQLYVTFADVISKHDKDELEGGSFFNFEEVERMIKKDEKIHPQLPPCFDILKRNREMVHALRQKPK